MLYCRLMFLLTRPWTAQDRSYVIGRKWICAIKWISAVSEAELCRIFLLRGTHWNSMGTLVIRLGARWRSSVTLLQFSIYFYLTKNKFCFYNMHFFIDSLQHWTKQAQRSHIRELDKDNVIVNSHKDKEQTLNNTSVSAQTGLCQVSVSVSEIWPIKPQTTEKISTLTMNWSFL